MKKALTYTFILEFESNNINGMGSNVMYIVLGIIVHKSEIPQISNPGNQTIPLTNMDKKKLTK